LLEESPDSQNRQLQRENAESLRPISEVFPFSGDIRRRLFSICTEWQGGRCSSKSRLRHDALRVRWPRHAMLARQLSQRIRTAIAQARDNQIPEPPDVVIHSCGSQLFRLVLEIPEASDLRFGRVIAVGSVIRLPSRKPCETSLPASCASMLKRSPKNDLPKTPGATTFSGHL
jgi:hypothetical protein